MASKMLVSVPTLSRRLATMTMKLQIFTCMHDGKYMYSRAFTYNSREMVSFTVCGMHACMHVGPHMNIIIPYLI